MSCHYSCPVVAMPGIFQNIAKTLEVTSFKRVFFFPFFFFHIWITKFFNLLDGTFSDTVGDFLALFKGWQLPKMQKYIPDLPLP